MPFAALARQKNLADTLSVRFIRAALSILHLQRRAAYRHSRRYVFGAAIGPLASPITVANGPLPPLASTTIRHLASPPQSRGNDVEGL
jgi:hypothetical protein